MNNIVQTSGVDTSSLNGLKIPNKTSYIITRDLILRSSHKKKLWCFDYYYGIWIYRRPDNRLCGDANFLSSGMEQELHTNTSNYGLLEST